MRIAIALLAVFLSSPGPEDTGEQFYKFKVGTKWTMKQTGLDEESKVTTEVTKNEDGKVWIESKEYRKDEESPKVKTLVWYVEGGLLVWAEKLLPVFNLYKLGSKKGDSWTAGPGMPEGAQAKHMGIEEVKVPAGTYKDAVHVQITIKETAADFYLAPGVGLIKTTMGDAGKVELTEFQLERSPVRRRLRGCDATGDDPPVGVDRQSLGQALHLELHRAVAGRGNAIEEGPSRADAEDLRPVDARPARRRGGEDLRLAGRLGLRLRGGRHQKNEARRDPHEIDSTPPRRTAPAISTNRAAGRPLLRDSLFVWHFAVQMIY